ncbi:MAG: hypothetical protein IPI49_25105 [Myxococcales bacterium]|nr:hypothetical protein [Myxococcales bacterium]
MHRPRWHDVLIVLAILGVGLAGVWALWGKELERALWPPPATSPGPSSSAS